MNILFIGSSHCAMIKKAFDQIPNNEKPFQAEFAAFTAPEISLQNSVGWKTEGVKLLCTEYLLRNKVLKGGGEDCVFANFDGVDVICYVDLFYCYDFGLIYFGQKKDGITDERNKIISQGVFERSLYNLLGTSSYKNHTQVNDVPVNNVDKMFAAVQGISPNSKKILIPRPLSPTQRIEDKFTSKGYPKVWIEFMTSVFDKVALTKLKERGISFISRPEDSIDINTGMTLNELSASWPKNALDEHLNMRYGKMILEQISRVMKHHKS